MEMGNRTGNCLQCSAKSNYRTTSVGYTGGQQTLPGRSWLIRLHIGCCTIAAAKWQVASHCLPFKITHQSWIKLQDIWQGAIGYNDSVSQMEALPPDQQRVWDLDRSPEPLLLLKSPNIEPTTSTMGNGTRRIQLHDASQTGKNKRQSWYPLETSRS